VFNKGSHTPGLNGITKQHVDGRQRGRERLVEQLREELLTGEYRPQPVKRIYIPKANGKLRPLGIATSKTEWYKLLSKWFWSLSTKVFHPFSWGFRPLRSITPSVHYAEDLQTPAWADHRGRYCCVFDEIDHRLLRCFQETDSRPTDSRSSHSNASSGNRVKLVIQ